MSEKKTGRIAYGKNYEIITEGDHVSVSGYEYKIISFFKEKIVVEKTDEKKIYNLDYKMIKTIAFNKKNNTIVFLSKHEDGIGLKNNLVVVSDMDEEGYRYFMEKLSAIKPDFKKLLDRANLKYKIINVYIPLVIIGAALLAILVPNLAPKKKSNWEKLDDNQKSWYERNYGDGKSKDIDDAISSYKKNH